jgi:nitrogen regulatory protein PII
VKKLEVCAPVELLEPLRTELTAGGIVTPALTVSCGWLDAGELGPGVRKAPKTRKASHCKVELVVSDRLAPRAVQIITDLLLTRKGDASAGHLVVLDVAGNYHFAPF